MINKMRVGIAATGGRWWMGGVVFVELLVKALSLLPRHERPEIYLIENDSALADFDLFHSCAQLADEVIYIGMNSGKARQILGEQVICCRSQGELFDTIDIYFPVNSAVISGRPAISWIPDFQHCYLPEFFSPAELSMRDILFKEISDTAKMLVFSSRAVEDDFWRIYPETKVTTKVLSYRLVPEASWYLQDPVQVQLKYKLPEQFVLCCNQFWVHKNHKVLFAAIAGLRRQGRDVHVVCTGKTDDYRWPNFFDQLVRYIKELGIADLVHILGLIPREDQIQLLRRCACVVQPSLFEGLSLIVCEARALGKPIIVSDLPVHEEQEYGVYFKRDSFEDLAKVLSDILAEARPGPDIQRERLAQEDAAQSVLAFAKQFCHVAETASKVFRNKL